MEGKNINLSNRVFTVLAVFLLGILLLQTLETVQSWKSLGGEYPREVTVDGMGSVQADPDLATINIGIHTEGANLDEVLAENTKKINDVMDAVKKFNVEDKDIQTTNYYVNPKYNWSDTKGSYQDGYTADQTITVKFRDFEKLGDLTAAASDSGANQISGVSFTLENPDQAKSEAREKAIANAKAKAMTIADETGLHLGKVTNFWENSYDPYYPMPYYYDKGGMGMSAAMSEDAVASTAPNIQPGQQEIQVTVSLTYRLK